MYNRVSLVIALILGYIIGNVTDVGNWEAITPYFACHAITEDSDIWDCNYQNGTWYSKVRNV